VFVLSVGSEMKKPDHGTIEFYLSSAQALAATGDLQGASSMALTGLYEMMPHVPDDARRFLVNRMMNADDLFGPSAQESS